MQQNIFELTRERFKFDKDTPIKVFESFSGVGMQLLALNRLGVKYESVGYSEIDKYAIKSYQAIHQDKNNFGDICKIKGKELPQIDLFTYSFPCTDLSKAGQQKGLNNTRSGLVYEVLRILQELKDKNRLPTVLLMENVVDLVQVKFIKQFNEIQAELEELGYSNYVQTLNAKDYGVAQNRDRVFMVSILGDYYYEFPKPVKLEKRLKDYLQPIEEIEQKYFLSDKQLEKIQTFKGLDNVNTEPKISYVLQPREHKGFSWKDTSPTLCARDYNDPKVILQPVKPLCVNSKVDGKQPSLQDRVYSDEAVSTCITSSFLPSILQVSRGIIIPEATKKGYAIAKEGDSLNLEHPNSATRRGRVGEQQANTLTTSCNQGVVIDAKTKLCNDMLDCGHLKEFDMIRHSYTKSRSENLTRKENENNISATLTTRPDTLGVVTKDCDKEYIIRKLTPLECWRLMGIDDKYFYKAKKVNSNAQLYKQAGNGIVVEVLVNIFKQLY